ncbi:MAG: hypothetical protein JKY56_26385, partial [Kofleriaceae bacterium]|nr:hypothetical protein [Kofleriaceae bacterium]
MTELWTSAIARLSDKIAPQNFDMWLRPIECNSIDGETLHLQAPNPYVKLWFESNYLETVLLEIKAATGTHYQVEFEVGESNDSTSDEIDEDEIPTQERLAPNVAPNVAGSVSPGPGSSKRDQTPMMGVRLQEHDASGQHQEGL